MLLTMRDRQGQVWEASSHMNGERIVTVVESRPANSRYGECTVHRCLHLSGRKEGRIVEWTEQGADWDHDPSMTRLV